MREGGIRRKGPALGILLLLTVSTFSALLIGSRTVWGSEETAELNAPWPMYGQNAFHTGVSPYAGPAEPALKWVFGTGNAIGNSPTIANGTIYVGSADNNLYALSPSGSMDWAWYNPSGLSVATSPALGSDGTIYVVANGATGLAAIYPNGTTKWTFAGLGGQFGPQVSSPAIGPDGTIVAGSQNGYVYAVSPNGKQLWNSSTSGAIYSSPAIGADGTVYIGSTDSNLYALRPGDGTKKWVFTADSPIVSSPVIGLNGTIYFISEDNTLYALKPDGSQEWAVSLGGYNGRNIASPAVGEDGVVYVDAQQASPSGITAFDAVYPNGTVEWSLPLSAASTPVIDANGVIYVGTNPGHFSGNLTAIDANGTIRWSYYTGAAGVTGVFGANPSIGANGTIYVAGCDFEAPQPYYGLCAITEQGQSPVAPLILSPFAGTTLTETFPAGTSLYYVNPLSNSGSPIAEISISGFPQGAPAPISVTTSASTPESCDAFAEDYLPSYATPLACFDTVAQTFSNIVSDVSLVVDLTPGGVISTAVCPVVSAYVGSLTNGVFHTDSAATEVVQVGTNTVCGIVLPVAVDALLGDPQFIVFVTGTHSVPPTGLGQGEYSLGSGASLIVGPVTTSLSAGIVSQRETVLTKGGTVEALVVIAPLPGSSPVTYAARAEAGSDLVELV